MRLKRYLKQSRLFIEQALYESGKAISGPDDGAARAPEFTSLEQRILMSASPAALVADAPQADSATDQSSLSDAQLLDVVSDSVLPSSDETQNLTSEAGAETAPGKVDFAELDSTSAQKQELVFIDSGVSNIAQLVADLESQQDDDDSRTFHVIVLEADRNGLAQITETLLQHDTVDGIHIVSHGDSGTVQLGSLTLSLDSFDHYRSAFLSWGHSMTDDADLLFYGCNLAATTDGQQLMQQISTACDCDVAASEDLTGHETLGGDWDLEYQVGDIENEIAFSDAVFETWQYVLASPHEITAAATQDGGLSLNEDGGNDAYLIADDGAGLLGGLTQLTFEIQFSASHPTTLNTLVSYAEPVDSNEFTLIIRDNGDLSVYIGTEVTSSAIDYGTLEDGNKHSLAVTWDSTSGDWEIFVNGSSVDSGSGHHTGQAIIGGGELVFGQEQDSLDGGYDPDQRFTGTLYNARLFDDVRTSQEIAASYAKTVPFDEGNLIADWHFDNLSSGGVVTELVSGNNLTVGHASGGGFTTSTPSLSLAVNENSANGTVVGVVEGADAERTAEIASLLGSDPDLNFNAETGKFYKAVTATIDWTSAKTAAESATLNGVTGQLATIRSAAESEAVTTIAATVGGSVWLGGTDQTTEGEWRWIESGSEADQFWSGAAAGNNINAAYHDWFSASEPNDLGGSEDGIRLDSTNGKWYDAPEVSTTHNYVIEWDADAVLDVSEALAYSIQSQTVSGAFTVNSDSGQLTVADSSLLDFESNATHTVTVRVTDVDSNTRDQAFTITLNDVSIEPTNVLPSAQNVVEDNDLTFSTGNGNAISVTDSSAGNSRLQVSLSVTNGVLQLSQLTGLTIVSGTDNSAAMVIDGTESDINAALEGMKFTPDGGYAGGANLQVTTSLNADLTGHYTFDAGNANDNSAGTAQNGTFFNDATTLTDGTRGEVLSLDGVGDATRVLGTFSDPSHVTLAAWVNLTSADVNGSEVISLGDNVILRADDSMNGGLVGSFYDGTDWVDLISTGITLAGQGWNHVAYTVDDTGNSHSLYLNGALVAQATTTGSISYALGSNTMIGAHGDGEMTYDFYGRIDDARIYTRALSAAEIASIAADQVSVTGNVAITVTPGNVAPTGLASGIAFNVDGGNDVYLGAANANFLAGAAGHTYEVAFSGLSTPGSGGMATFYSHRNAGVSQSYLSVHDDGRLDWAGVTTSGTYTQLFDGSFHTVALTWTAATGDIEFYVDGSNVESASIAPQASGTGGQSFVLGQHVDYSTGTMDSDEAFQGTMHDFRVWDHARSSSEIDNNRLSSFDSTNVPTGLLANWRMSSLSGGGSDTIVDLVNPGGNDLTVQNYGAGGGFTTSTASDSLTVAENSSNGTHIGYVRATDPDFDETHTFTLTDSAGGRFVINSTTGEITVADGSLLDYELISSHNITVEVTDSDSNTYSQAITIAVNNVADATLTVPSSATTNEDEVLTFSTGYGNAITIDSGTANAPVVSVTLSVSNGALTLASTTGIDFLNGTSDGDASVTISGFESDVNTALDGLQYLSDLDYNGSDTLTVTTGSSAATEVNIYARYEFANGSTNDVSGNTRHGIAGGDPTLTVDSERGDVMTFDGDDYVSVANATSSLGEEITVAGWVNLDAGQTDNVFLSIGDEFFIRLDPSNPSYNIGATVGGFSLYSLNSAHNVAGTGWHHLTATLNDTTNQLRVYLDGQLTRASNFGGMDADWATAASQNITIGALSDGSSAFVGSLDDLRIYDVVLTEAEIAAIMGDHGYATDNVAVTVNFVNDAPTVGSAFLTSITEDNTSPPGETISTLFGGSFNDVDSGSSMSGVAITSNNAPGSEGIWQYSTDNGSNWYDVGVVNSSSSLALSSSTHVRFVPAADFSGSPTAVSLRALDNTHVGGFSSGATRVTTDTGSPGGSSPISSSLVSLTHTVTAVNDAPVADLNGSNGSGIDFSAAFTEGGGAVYAIDTDATISDVDHSQYQSLGISLSGFVDGASEHVLIASFQFDYGVGLTTTTTVGSTPFELAFDGTAFTITRDGGGTMPQADLQSLFRTIRYNNSSLTPTAGNRTLSITPQDAAGLNATPAVSTVSVTPASSTPTVTATVPGALVVNEDSSITFAAGNGNAIVVDDGTAGTDTRMQVSLSVADGQLKLSQLTGLTFASGVDDSAFMVIHGTEANINAALEGMTFTPTADFSGNPSLQVSASLDADLAALYSFEGGNADNDSYGSGADGTFIADATTVIDGTRGEVLSLDGSGDRVEINDIFGSPTSVSVGSWVNLSSTGRAELISLDNSVVVSLDATGLDGDGLVGSTRTGSFSWNELESGQYISSTGWRHVMYTFDDALNNHRLYIDGVEVESGGNGSSIRYTGASTTYIGAHPSNSGWNLGGLIDDIRVYSRALSADEIASLAGDTNSATANVSITVTPVNDAPVLTTQPGGGTRYENDTFGTYVDTAVTITDIDGLDFSGGILTTTISNNAETGDQLQFIDGLGVVISGSNITYDDGGGAVMVATFTGGNDHTTPLVITFNSNADAAAVQAVARQIVFLVTGDDPTSAQRTLTMQVTDGDTGTSSPETRILSVVPVNDPPVASTTALSPTFVEDSTAVPLFSSTSVDLVEAADAVQSLRITVDGLTAGSDDFLVVDGQMIELTDLNSETTAANSYTVDVTITGNTATMTVSKPGGFSSFAAVNLIDSLSYGNTSDVLTSGVRSVTWVEIVDDGAGLDSTIVNTTSTVTISPVNDAPVVDLNGTNGGGVNFFNTFTEGGGPVDVTDLDAAISDIDDTMYQSLSINLNAFVDGADEHIHIDGHKFDYGVSLTRVTTIGSTVFEIDFDGGGFNITRNISGMMPTADLQTLLRTLRYDHTSVTPTIAHRTIDIFVQDDGGLNSTTAVATIAVSGSNSRPTLTAFSSSVENTTEDTEVEVSFNDLAFHGNEMDVDGTVVAFVVKSVPSGTLRIGTNAGTATAYVTGVNDTIDISNHAYWTPANDVNGTYTAFTVVTEDDLGLESIGNIGAQVWIGPQNDTPVGLPTILGTPTEDQVLTASTVGISDVDGLGSFSYQWLRNNIAIGGATASSYTLTDSDVGTRISVEVRYTDGGGTNEGPITSAQTSAILNINDLPTGTVTVDNLTPNLGDTLTVTDSLADADGLSATITYQWQRNGVDISGATAGTYTTGLADVGTVISVIAAYTDDHGTLESVSSTATAAVTNSNSPPTGSVTISGVPSEDQILTAANTLSDTDGMGPVTYQWQRNGSDIVGAIGVTYTPGDSDVGAMISVVASYTDGAANPESVSSGGVGPITNINDEESLTVNTLLTVFEGSTGTIVSDFYLMTNDIDNSSAQLVYTLVTETVNGTLRLSGVPLTISSTFTQADVNSGSLTYDHFGTETSTDGFDFTVDDGAGSVTSARFGIVITSVNDNDPVITSLGGGPNGIVVAAENTIAVTIVTATDADLPSQTLAYRIVGGTDAARMSIDSVSGALSFLTAPDFESPTDADADNLYEVIVEVADGGGRIDTQTIQIRITDIDEFDVSPITDTDATADAIDENSAAGTSVGIAAFAIDADATANVVTYSLDNNAGGLFTINPGSGLVTTTASLDREITGGSLSIVVRATSADGSSTTRGFAITVNDQNDTAPVVTAGQVLTVTENASSGTSVGFIVGSDVDTVGNLQNWSITGGNLGGNFALNAATGQITVTNPAGLDFETLTNHTLVITVDDGVQTAAPQSITILVTDQNETPVAIDDTYAVEQFSTLSTGVNAVTANDSDVDGDSLMAILLTGPLHGTVVLNTDGSFEYTPNGAFSGSDEFTYFASDGLLSSSAATVSIAVNPISVVAPTTTVSVGVTDTLTSDSNSSIDNAAAESTDATEPGSDQSTTNTEAVLAALGRHPAGLDADADFQEAVHGDSASREILRRTSSEAFIAIFLAEIPEFDDVKDDQRNSRRATSDNRHQNDRSRDYLFDQVDTANPLLSARNLKLQQTTPGDMPQADAFRRFLLEKVVVGSTAVVSTSVSVGYAAWLLRGGSLLTTFLSSMPVWQSFDPLPVLDSFDQQGPDEDDESLLTMVS